MTDTTEQETKSASITVPISEVSSEAGTSGISNAFVQSENNHQPHEMENERPENYRHLNNLKLPNFW